MKMLNPLLETLLDLLSLSNWKDKRHKLTLAWMIYGLIQVREINLPEWIPFVSSRARKAQSTERRFSRWVNNDRINVEDIYSPLIKQALHDWGKEVLYVALDTSMLWNKFCQIRICVIYRGRSVPLVWKTIKHGSSSIKFSEYKDLLEQAKTLLPTNKRIIFLADRGFANVKLMSFLSQELSWNWRIRCKVGYNIYRPSKQKNKRFCKVKITAQYGHSRFYHRVYLTDEYYGEIHLAFARHSGKKETWLIVSDEPTSLETFKEYGLRFDIEEGFKDDKSGLFELELSKLRDANALTRLYTVIAVATLFLVSQGVDVVKRGIRCEIDPHWKRSLSYLKIGLRYVALALVRGYQFVKKIILPSTADPELVRSSKGKLSTHSRIDRFQSSVVIFT